MADDGQNGQTAITTSGDDAFSVGGGSDPPPAMSKSARKKLAKQERQAARKAARKAAEKERHRADVERRRREWEEKLASAPSEEKRARLVEVRRASRRERVGRRNEERSAKAERLRRAAAGAGHKIVVDLEFADLMRPNEIHSLTQQIMYCYAVNGRCETPAHLWLTGCSGELATQLQRIPGFDKWIIEKESRPYIEVFQDRKESLVYLTADVESVLDKFDPTKIYIIGGLVDRNRWKGITMKKANDQGIQSAKLPIGNYLKMSSSQVLTVNQVFEIMLKFLETKDWRTAFFHVIPQRKRGEVEAEGSMSIDAVDEVIGNGDVSEEEEEKVMENKEDEEEEEKDEGADDTRKRRCIRGENGEAEAGPSDVAAGMIVEEKPAADLNTVINQGKEAANGAEEE